MGVLTVVWNNPDERDDDDLDGFIIVENNFAAKEGEKKNAKSIERLYIPITLRNYLRGVVDVVIAGFEREKVKGVVGRYDDEITTVNESYRIVGIKIKTYLMKKIDYLRRRMSKESL